MFWNTENFRKNRSPPIAWQQKNARRGAVLSTHNVILANFGLHYSAKYDIPKSAMAEAMIQDLGSRPVTSAQLYSCMRGYNAPPAHVAVLKRRGEVVPLRRGLYVCRREGTLLSEGLIANQIVTPSYISYETALSWHGIIPERVAVVRSACTARSKEFRNATGRYTYTQVAPGYFELGQTMQGNGVDAYVIARPEKALCDLILSTPRLRLQSPRAARTYAEYYLRVDMDELAGWDADLIHACALAANKKNKDLLHLERMIRDEQRD